MLVSSRPTCHYFTMYGILFEELIMVWLPLLLCFTIFHQVEEQKRWKNEKFACLSLRSCCWSRLALTGRLTIIVQDDDDSSSKFDSAKTNFSALRSQKMFPLSPLPLEPVPCSLGFLSIHTPKSQYKTLTNAAQIEATRLPPGGVKW